MKKKNKGVTLVALIVIIIILLIIAGISIASLTGNGIFNNAQKATSEYDKQTAIERINLKITNIQIASYIETKEIPSLQNLADELCEDNEIEYVLVKNKTTASLDKINVGEANTIFTKLKQYSYEFEIDKSLRLASIDGVKLAANDTSNEELNAKIEEMQLAIESLKADNEKLKTDNEALKTEVASLKQKDQSLESSISNINTSMGTLTFTELASTTSTSSTNTVTLKDSLVNYKYVMVVFKGVAGTYFPSGLVSVDVFKAMSGSGYLGSTNGSYTMGCKYISNTKCYLSVSSGSGATAYIYGVK